MMNETLVKYLAGLLDADGVLEFTFDDDRRVALRLVLHALGDPAYGDLLLTLSREAGHIESQGRGGGGDVAWLVTKRSELEKLLPRVVKHMVVKAKHWQFLLDMWRVHRSALNAPSPEVKSALLNTEALSRRERVGPLKPKNHPTWAWLAGYLDGRAGRYGAVPMRVEARAHVGDIAVLRFLQNAFGGTIRPHRKSRSTSVWHRSLGPGDRSFARHFLPRVAKHSRVRRHVIDSLIHAHQQRLSPRGTKPPAPSGDADVQATV
jgi:hypothetical protein